MIGLLLAASGVALHEITGSGGHDGIASLAIAGLLAFIAVRLGRTNMRLLTGNQADPRLARRSCGTWATGRRWRRSSTS